MQIISTRTWLFATRGWILIQCVHLEQVIIGCILVGHALLANFTFILPATIIKIAQQSAMLLVSSTKER